MNIPGKGALKRPSNRWDFPRVCGIAGIIANGRSIAPEWIERMTLCLRHRGPDAHGISRLPRCHLGHRRLSIIDLASGNQPMSDESGRFSIVFNGEIYNYRELRRTLARSGWRFRSSSDTEVLLRAYQEYGERALVHLKGQFAFAIWDNEDGLLFAARDRFGEKPFFWANSSDGSYFLFGSEIKCLLDSDLIKPKLDLLSVDAYLVLYHIPPDRTVYENVYTLRPGHALSWRSGRCHTWAYWSPRFSVGVPVTDTEAVEHLRFLINQAVRRQMVADVPVGAFLSGGYDSSTIVALMSQESDKAVKTFSLGFGTLINELPYAREIARRYGTDHHEIQMDMAVGEMLERMAEVYDEPFADSSNIPTYLISKFASRSVKAVLSGDGGDELFGGYVWYQTLLKRNLSTYKKIQVAIARMLENVWRPFSGIDLPVLARCGDAQMRGKMMADWIEYISDPWEGRVQIGTMFFSDRAALWKERYSPSETRSFLRSTYKPRENIHGIDRVSTFDVCCYLPGDILVKVDRAAMAHGLETRAPFLDVDLVEFVWSLPQQVRFQSGQRPKHLLHAACDDLLPESLKNRPKQGFGAPIEHWVQRPDVRQLVNRVLAQGSPLNALFPGLRNCIPSAGVWQEWTLLCLGLWLERHSDCLHEVII